MIVKKENGMVDETKLNKKERLIFITFLEMEKQRHKEDINNINKTIKYLLTSKNATKR